jgi:solute carrier family 25 phosphate transporter 3
MSQIKAKVSPFNIPQFTARDYSSFCLAGAICCTVTHGAMTPVDVVKTRIQIDPTFKGLGILSGTRKVIASEGPAALLTGFGPSA